MNEQMNSPESQKQYGEKRKVKEALSTDELKVILRGWLDALEQNKDFDFQIKGHSGKVPQKILQNNTTMGEFEFKKGEYEFELELKWKEGAEKNLQ